MHSLSLAVRVFPVQTKFTTYTNDTIEILGRCEPMTLVIHEYVCRICPYVAQQVDIDCLLGMDFVRAHINTIDVANNKLHLTTSAQEQQHYDAGHAIRYVEQHASELDIALKQLARQSDVYAQRNLRTEHFQKLVKILINFRTLFISPDGLPPVAEGVEHQIHVTAPPIRQRPYRTAQAVDAQLFRYLMDGVRSGLLRPGSGEWASPLVAVPKKDPIHMPAHSHSTRHCGDYRLVNAVTRPDPYAIPLPQDVLDALAGSIWFTILDIKSAYNQIRVAEASIPITAVTTKYGLFEYLRMPFGLRNAPATWQRYINDVLKPNHSAYCKVYLDDIIIYSQNLQQHFVHVEATFDLLQSRNITLNMNKCQLFKQRVVFLGYVLTPGAIQPDDLHIHAITLLNRPTTVTAVRSFIGMANYYHRFIPQFATIAKPLYALQKKNVPFIWTDACEQAFCQLKQLLTNTSI